MSVKKIRRQILAVSGVDARGNVVFSTNAGLRHDVESLTGSSVAQTLSAYGASFLTYGTSGKTNDFILPNPPAAGIQKHVFVVNNTTSIELNLNTASTANTFWGTTFNTATLAAEATGSPGGTPHGTIALTLIAQSTSQWALVSPSTKAWDLTGSTGSTSTPDP